MTSSGNKTFAVRLGPEGFKFACAHFVIGTRYCERLHGHNYELEVIIKGDQDEDFMVIDFLDIKPLLRSILEDWDHKTLLAANCKDLKFTKEDGFMKMVLRDGKMYEIPEDEVVLLPIANTTVEEFSRLLCEKLVEELQEKENIHEITCIVYEMKTQRASCTIEMR